VPFRGLTGTVGCDQMSRVIDYVVSDPTITTVILASGWAGRSTDEAMQLKSPVGLRSDSTVVFETGLHNTIEALTSAKKRVYLVLEIPHFPKGPFFCAPPRPFAPKRGEVCSVPKLNYIAATRRFESAIQGALAGKAYPIQLIRPEKVLCDEAQCWIRREGALLYRDTNHLSIDGSKYVGGEIGKELFRSYGHGQAIHGLEHVEPHIATGQMLKTRE